MTDDLVIIEATDTSALPTKSRTSRGPRDIYSLSQFVDNIRSCSAIGSHRLMTPSSFRRPMPPLSPQIKNLRGPHKKAPRKKRRAQDISSNGRRITPYPNWLKAYASMNGSAIERFVEQRRRAQQPLVGIASSHWRNVKRLRRTAAMSGGHCKE